MIIIIAVIMSHHPRIDEYIKHKPNDDGNSNKPFRPFLN